MVFVFTAIIAFFSLLFWTIERLNRLASHEPYETRSSEVA